MRESPGDHAHEADLVMVRNDGSTFDARLDCLRKTGVDESWTLRIALVDISRLKQAEAELRIAAIAFESREGMMITDAQGMILKVNPVSYTHLDVYKRQNPATHHDDAGDRGARSDRRRTRPRVYLSLIHI